MNDITFWILLSLLWMLVWPLLHAAIVMADLNDMVKSAREMNPKASIHHPLPRYWDLVKRLWWLQPKLGPFWCGYYCWRGPADWEVIQRK